jgi:hypothetical protein
MKEVIQIINLDFSFLFLSFPIWTPDTKVGDCENWTNRITDWTQKRKNETRLFIEAQLDAVNMFFFDF